jgi:RND family efflux transporter MFP subunit
MSMNLLQRILALAAAVVLLVACSESKAPQDQVQPVRVARVSTLAAQPAAAITATGLVRAREEVPLAFKVGGIIRELRVEAGQTVKAGEVLASLDLTEIEAQVNSARDALVRAERELERATTLFAKGMVAQRVEQDARTQRDQAKAALAALQFNRQYAVITAPAVGVILQKRAEARETVAVGQPVLLLGRLDGGWVVRAGLPARDALLLKPGNAATVRLDAVPHDPLAGRVTRVAAASDARTGTLEVEIALPQSSHSLVSGMVAHLSFAGNVEARVADMAVIALPLPAVLEGNDSQAKVFVLAADGKKVKRLNVRTGRLLNGAVEVVDGLPAEADVVIEGAGWLSDGDTVRVLP